MLEQLYKRLDAIDARLIYDVFNNAVYTVSRCMDDEYIEDTEEKEMRELLQEYNISQEQAVHYLRLYLDLMFGCWSSSKSEICESSDAFIYGVFFWWFDCTWKDATAELNEGNWNEGNWNENYKNKLKEKDFAVKIFTENSNMDWNLDDPFLFSKIQEFTTSLPVAERYRILKLFGKALEMESNLRYKKEIALDWCIIPGRERLRILHQVLRKDYLSWREFDDDEEEENGIVKLSVKQFPRFEDVPLKWDSWQHDFKNT